MLTFILGWTLPELLAGRAQAAAMPVTSEARIGGVDAGPLSPLLTVVQ